MRIISGILLALIFSAALAQTAPQSVYLPLAQRSAAATAMPLPTSTPTPTPLPGPVRIILPPEVGEPEHVLGAFAIGCHRDTLNCYYFAIIKFFSGNQDGIVLRLRPGAAITELVARIDQPDDFTGPIALGSGVLLPDGSIDLAFSACTNGATYGTGCTAYRWRIVGVDVPFNGARIQGDGRAVEVVR